MITTAIFPARYVQGEGALDNLGEDLARLGRKALAVVDPFVLKTLRGRLVDAAAGRLDLDVQEFGGECSDEEIARLTALARAQGAEVVAGVGGGKALDTAKAVAHELNARTAIVPTLASTDAPCSALSVIYTADGAFKRYLVLPRNPDLVLVDTGVVAQAPVRFLVSGMGDALSTWFEAEDCRIKRGGNMTGRMGPMTAFSLARLCYDTLLEYGVLAKSACEQKVVTPALERIVEANTLLSGLGFESGGLAAAHAVHNGLTALEETHHYWHGEKVAFGTLTMLVLTGRPAAVLDEVYGFCRSVGLPTTLADIGLATVSDERLLLAAERACAEGETIHNEPYEVTPRRVLAAMKAADAEGRRRKGL
ncbi:glycerol dehydrogenase [Azospirillum thermophilum]|uniref:Glycerol dehydrogenase n=1 Tax=Azospirillum thermophilum TaxID=2202148 RepID=A0A2S2CSE7_9PROT|nr:glycerol dehydrogenase [Azospirillum thermophilum]AWK87217.1 glycerol dehydrogenase [Azospirillum thermophilum]